jgi:hypothetical protein
MMQGHNPAFTDPDFRRAKMFSERLLFKSLGLAGPANIIVTGARLTRGLKRPNFNLFSDHRSCAGIAVTIPMGC